MQTIRTRIARLSAASAVIVSLGALGAGALLAPQANAAAVESGSLTMTSDQGDYVGGGQQYGYDTSAGDTFGVSSSRQSVSVNVQAANGGWWLLDFAAPQGQTLAAGTYDGATRSPMQDPSVPGLSVFGNGAGCNTLTGSFTVTQIAFGSAGELQSFDADFEQHCEGADAALRGHVHVVATPPAPPLSIAIGLDAKGVADRVSGSATVSGTVTCSAPTMVWLSGTLTQRTNAFAKASGRFDRQVACSGTTRWQATVDSDTPFKPGSAQLKADAFAYDPGDWHMVADTQTKTMKLER